MYTSDACDSNCSIDKNDVDVNQTLQSCRYSTPKQWTIGTLGFLHIMDIMHIIQT